MEELLKFLIKQIIENDNFDIISEEESEKVIILKANVSKEDIGKVIGKNGKVANALRTIIKTASQKTGKKYIVKIGEREEN